MATNAELAKSNKALKAQRSKTKRVEEECEEAIVAEQRASLMRKLIGKAGGLSGARGVGAWSHKSATLGGEKLEVPKSAVVAGVGYLGAVGAALVTKRENMVSAFVEGMADAGLHVWQYESQREAMRRRDTRSPNGTVTMGDGGRVDAGTDAVRPSAVEGVPRHIGAGEMDPATMQQFMEQVRAEAFEEGARAQAEEIERQMQHAGPPIPHAPPSHVAMQGPAHGAVAGMPPHLGMADMAEIEASHAAAADAADGVA